MASIGSGLRVGMFWAFAALAAVVAVTALQLLVPERTVIPVAERFVCDGIVELDKTAPRYGVLTEVDCNHGLRSEDITWLTLTVVAIPTVLALAAAGLLAQRMLVPNHQSRMRRVNA